MLLAWLVFPLVLAALTLGCGLLVARAVPLEIPAPLLMPLGFAAVSLIGQFALLGGSATVTFAAPVVVALAVAGIGLSIPPRSPGRHVGLALAVVGAFVVFSAPFVLSGLATFGGYIKLDDTATYLAMLDRAMRHGYDVGSLPPSTYEATLVDQPRLRLPAGLARAARDRSRARRAGSRLALAAGTSPSWRRCSRPACTSSPPGSSERPVSGRSWRSSALKQRCSMAMRSGAA